MTAAIHHHGNELNVEHDLADALSPEPDKRSVELAFLRRLDLVAGAAAANILGSAKNVNQATFTADFAFVRSPVFAKMARVLEKSIPEDVDFGPFRGR